MYSFPSRGIHAADRRLLESVCFVGIGYLLHFAPDSWQNACCRGVVKLPLLGKALLLVVLIYLVIQIKSSDIQPFIYFQF